METAVEEAIACPKCGFRNAPGVRMCAASACRTKLKTDLECLRSIDLSARSIKRIMIFWTVIAIIGLILSVVVMGMK